MTPEPSPLLWLELASTDTVDGSTLAATSCTEPAGAAVRLSETGALVFSWLSELSPALAELVFSCAAEHAAAEPGDEREGGGGGHDRRGAPALGRRRGRRRGDRRWLLPYPVLGYRGAP